MTVWIVSRGEHYEGSRIINVCIDRVTALKKVLMMISHREPWQEPWSKTSEDYWESGCDYIKLVKHEVISR